jgi:hypothetical protein
LSKDQGAIYDRTQSYQWVFIFFIVFFTVSAALVWLAAPRKVRPGRASWQVGLEIGGGPHWLDSLMMEISSESVCFVRHQAASANG